MRTHSLGILSTALLALAGLQAPARAAETYDIDPVHSSVSFKIGHLGISWVHGRFDDVSGSFVLDKDDPSKSSFTLTIKTESVDTNNAKRNDHLRSPDFFNAKQFPVITFKSTAVKAVEGGLEVAGDFTMHGVTKPVRLLLRGGKGAEFPKGKLRIGYITDLTLKRSDFGMDKMLNALSDEVPISIGLEGVKQ